MCVLLIEEVQDNYAAPRIFKSLLGVLSSISNTRDSVSCNISNTRDSVSSGYPNSEKREENTTRIGVFFTEFDNSGCLDSR